MDNRNAVNLLPDVNKAKKSFVTRLPNLPLPKPRINTNCPELSCNMRPSYVKMGDDHINKSIQQINSDTWQLPWVNLVLRRQSQTSSPASVQEDATPPIATWIDDIYNTRYTLTSEQPLLPSSTTSTRDSPIKLIYEMADQSAVWSIGSNVVCKVKYTQGGHTSESATLNFVHNQPRTFETPKVLHHAHGADRNYLFMSRVLDRTLQDAWPTLNEYWQSKYHETVVGIYQEMAQWRGKILGGVDGGYICENFLDVTKSKDLLKSCQNMGMDCSDLIFQHADMGPLNISILPISFPLFFSPQLFLPLCKILLRLTLYLKLLQRCANTRS